MPNLFAVSVVAYLSAFVEACHAIRTTSIFVLLLMLS